MVIIKPCSAPEAYSIAADAFREYWQRVTGENITIVESWQDDDCVLIGADDVLDAAGDLIMEGLAEDFGLRYGTDDYCIKSFERNGHKVLLCAGGRGRSTIYAVYDYFHIAANVSYYWDGDSVPTAESLPLDGFDLNESPRFDYRGLRYFAHRSLTRFQAEHWGLADWQREIDWMCKRRLNYFMLRIGHDDVFQQAFPELVPYPDPNKICPEYDPETMPGYDDRTVFWPLEYRGKLRKMVLDYAFARDLIHSEDCGTMTHWYSRTPKAYLDAVHPDFVPQTTAGYRQPTGQVWDIRKQENLEQYFKLTDAYVRCYGKPELFHTIGLAERMCYEKRRDNLKLKLYTYRKISRFLHEKYPTAKLLIASWDFVMYWEPEEVQRLMQELDPERTILLDYTSESTSPENYFKNWGVQYKFPWIFGIFHAYESNSDIRGDYAHIEERLREAVPDPYCRGLIFWPELSHSDTLMLEYFTNSAWKPLNKDAHECIKDLCFGRYGKDALQMQAIWEQFYPLIKLSQWKYDRKRPTFQMNRDFMQSFLVQPFALLQQKNPEAAERFDSAIRYYASFEAAYEHDFAPVITALAALTPEQLANPFLFRDAMDIARSTVSRRINMWITLLEVKIRDILAGDASAGDGIPALCDSILRLTESFGELLALHEDYSLNASFKRLSEETTVNTCFEDTLKRNASCGYCQSHIAELVPNLYLPEMRFYFDHIRRDGKLLDLTADQPDYLAEYHRISDAFVATSLEQLAPAKPRSWKELMAIINSQFVIRN